MHQLDGHKRWPLARILSVSYDVSLLGTRQLILRDQGHEVVSALGFTEALKQCQNSRKFHLFILGHSIPHSDKEALISAFRADCAAPIIVLTNPSEKPVSGADVEIEPEPQIVVEAVKRLTSLKTEGADEALSRGSLLPASTLSAPCSELASM